MHLMTNVEDFTWRILFDTMYMKVHVCPFHNMQNQMRSQMWKCS